jgi:hypothetical protein
MRNAGAWDSPAGRHRIPQVILGRNEWSGIKFGVFGHAKPKLAITRSNAIGLTGPSYVLAVWLGRITRRLGYLSEEQFGYALARIAYERENAKPKWPSFLSTNIKSFMKRSGAWLTANRAPRLLSGR